MNSLQDWMDFAEKNGLFNQYKNTDHSSPQAFSNFQPTQFNVPMMEANWARQQAGAGMPPMPGGQQPPNFFANLGQAPQGVTIGDNPFSARAQAVQSQPYQAPQGLNNYLARLLQR